MPNRLRDSALVRVCLLASPEDGLPLPKQDVFVRINREEWESLQAFANNFLRSGTEKDRQRFMHYYKLIIGHEEDNMFPL